MQITNPCVITLTWRLEDTCGNLVDELQQPLEFFFGGTDLLSKVEEALADQGAGFRAMLQLEPEHAFGDYDAKLVFFENRSLFPDDTDVGTQFNELPPGCTTPDMPLDTTYTVTELYPSHVVLDGNHPLAGMALRLDVVVCDVRAATKEEIACGSVTESPVTVLDLVAPSHQIH